MPEDDLTQVTYPPPPLDVDRLHTLAARVRRLKHELDQTLTERDAAICDQWHPATRHQLHDATGLTPQAVSHILRRGLRGRQD